MTFRDPGSTFFYFFYMGFCRLALLFCFVFVFCFFFISPGVGPVVKLFWSVGFEEMLRLGK